MLVFSITFILCASFTFVSTALPQCGENETPSVCTKECPPQTCDSLLEESTKKPCIPGPCRRGCNCKDGYLKNSQGQCILMEMCPKPDDQSTDDGQDSDSETSEESASSSSSSSYSSVETLTVSDVDVPKNEPETDNQATDDEQDSDSETSESASSSSSSSPCSAETLTVTDMDVPKNEPESSNKCRLNETYVFCNAGCPTNYCPVDDRRGIIMCSPPHPCPSGCACAANHKRVSVEDDRCILASDCPPVNCTRSNEAWYACPPPCYSDNCRDIGVERECYRSGPDCQPQCACVEGFYRNDAGDCVSKEQCA